jgi:hypothetical protein
MWPSDPFNYYSKIFRLVYDDPAPQEEPQQEEPQQEEPPHEEPQPEPHKTPKRMISEDELQKRLADERKKFTNNNKQLLSQLKDFRESLNMTEDQKATLEQHIERLTNESLTAQEVAKRDREKMAKEFQAQLEKERREAENWRRMYTEEKIERELTDAAIENKAYAPSQIKNILKPQAKLVPELTKDGQPTGKWVPKIAWQDKKEDGELITLELSPSETVKRMSELNEHLNLFNSGANGGLGSFSAPTKTSAGSKPPADPAAFRKWAKENNITGKR